MQNYFNISYMTSLSIVFSLLLTGCFFSHQQTTNELHNEPQSATTINEQAQFHLASTALAEAKLIEQH